ncbi:MAG: Flagellar motor switch protein FliM [Candidatus Erwinia impunctatus]|nr:Flagellar motor switch protein FliM [Culicoides impunctatus]
MRLIYFCEKNQRSTLFFLKNQDMENNQKNRQFYCCSQKQTSTLYLYNQENLLLFLPLSMIEPLRETLANPPLENSREEDHYWRNTLAQQVQHSELDLIANFADVSLRISQLLKMQPGDVLPIEKPERIIAHVDGVPVLTSKYGCVNGQYALQVEHLINPILNSMNEEQPDE